MLGIMGDMFDINGDGNLDVFEQALEVQFLVEMEKKESEDKEDEEDGDN